MLDIIILMARTAQKLFIERIMKSQNCSEYQIFQSFCKHIMQNKENLQQWKSEQEGKAQLFTQNTFDDKTRN